MRMFAAFACAAALALSACGSSDDASDEAIADTVEMPADDAMEGTPMPVEAPVTAEPDPAGDVALDPADEEVAPVADDADAADIAAEAAVDAAAEVQEEARVAEQVQ